MKKPVKFWFSLLTITNLLSLVAVGVLAYSNWQLNQRLEQTQAVAHQWNPGSATGSPQAPGLTTPSWDPFAPLGNAQQQDPFAAMHQRMQQMLERFSSGNDWFNSPLFSTPGLGLGSGSPKISTEDKGDYYRVTVTLPEGQSMEINTEIEDQQLRIHGKVEQSSSHPASGLAQSFSSSEFTRTITLPEPVDEAAMTVEQKDHRVEIKIPKRKSS
jgi:HSP20 family molecular chaperone IbpA